MVDALMTFFGRTHLVFLHLPIGIAVGLFLYVAYTRYWLKKQLPDLSFAFRLLALTATYTAVSGWLLSGEGAYSEEALFWHKWLGTCTAACTILIWMLRHTRWANTLVMVSCAGILATGHAGGSLTHGEGFLSEPFLSKKTEPIEAESQGPQTVFAAAVNPILQEKCVSCHKPSKRKGDLDLSQKETLLQGGEHGALFDLNVPENSLLLQRILLPLHEKEHMPPKSKNQLSNRERETIELWLKLGAPFDQPLAEYPELLALVQPDVELNPVYNMEFPPLKAATNEGLKQEGVSLDLLDPNSNALSLSCTSGRVLTSEAKNYIQSIQDQIVHADLAGAPIDESIIRLLAGMPHLVRLNLARTQIKNEQLELLGENVYLEYLNISNTQVSHLPANLLKKWPSLHSVYTFGSELEPGLLDELKSKFPEVSWHSGAPIDEEEPIQLNPPEMRFSRTFFDDTLQLSLHFPFRSVGVYYTMKNDTPGLKSNRYEKPLIIDKTTTIRAVAAKEGWLTSPIVEKTFIKRTASAVDSRISKQPAPQYTAKGARSLIDGVLSEEQGADSWLGYQGEHLEAVLELKEKSTVKQVFVHCLENNAPWIFKPKAIQVWVSDDDKKYTFAGSRNFEGNKEMGIMQAHLLRVGLDQEQEARYVKVRVESPLKLPVWHPSAGEKCWIFVDEIILD
ncbi:MAG: c-type cytochrome domain-containing protein [Saprospiraceae bacterium]